MSAYNKPDFPESFLPTTENFSADSEKSMEQLNSVYTDIAKQVNSKEIGRYEFTEMLTGQQFADSTDIQKRNLTYRKLFNFGAIAPGATLLIPHGITNIPSAVNPTGKTIFTRIYGTYLDSLWYQKPISYASNIGTQFQLDIKVDSTNIILVNGLAGTSSVVSGKIVLEYLKN
jgi:hypothetical protein